MEYIKIRDLKEHWLAGSAEVSIRAKLHCHNNRKEGLFNGEEQPYSSDQNSDFLGKLIKKVRRRDKNELFLVDYSLQTNWQASQLQTDPIFFDFVIFEKDNFPAYYNKYKIPGRRDVLQGPAGGPFTGDKNLYYRAAEAAYEDRHLPYENGAIVNNGSAFYAGWTGAYFYATGVCDNSEIFFTLKGF